MQGSNLQPNYGYDSVSGASESFVWPQLDKVVKMLTQHYLNNSSDQSSDSPFQGVSIASTRHDPTMFIVSLVLLCL